MEKDSLSQTPNKLDDEEDHVLNSFYQLQSELNDLTNNLENQYSDICINDDTLNSLNQLEPINIKKIINVLNNNDLDYSRTESNPNKSNTDKDQIQNANIFQTNNLSLFMNSNENRDLDNGFINSLNTTSTSYENDSILLSSQPNNNEDCHLESNYNITQKISELLLSLQNRTLLTDGINDMLTDEWDDDDDNGYLIITLSEDEFFELEEVLYIQYMHRLYKSIL